jgi:hypothetical protein
LAQAARLLRKREHFAHELRLALADFPAEEVELALESLRSKGLQSEARALEWWGRKLYFFGDQVWEQTIAEKAGGALPFPGPVEAERAREYAAQEGLSGGRLARRLASRGFENECLPPSVN